MKLKSLHKRSTHSQITQANQAILAYRQKHRWPDISGKPDTVRPLSLSELPHPPKSPVVKKLPTKRPELFDFRIKRSDIAAAARVHSDLSRAFGQMGALHSPRDGILLWHGGNRIGQRDSMTGPFYQLAFETAQRLGREQWKFLLSTRAEGASLAAVRATKDFRRNILGIEVSSQDRIDTRFPTILRFQDPFTRILAGSIFADAEVFLPGGFGTLHALFEALTLIQTGIMPRHPIILLGTAFWRSILEPVRESFLKPVIDEYPTISENDLDLFHLTDDPNEVVRLLSDYRANTLHHMRRSRGVDWSSPSATTDFADDALFESLLTAHIFGRLGLGASLFGTARSRPSSPSYQKDTVLSYLISRLLGEMNEKEFGARTFDPYKDGPSGFHGLATGGGPGTMEAGNVGAYEAGIPSVGLGIHLPFEQSCNPYITPGLGDAVEFRFFFLRLEMFARLSGVSVLGHRGGWGSLHEFFKIMHAMRRGAPKKAKKIYVAGTDFWEKPLRAILDELHHYGLDQSPRHKNNDPLHHMVHFSNDPEEIALSVRRDLEAILNSTNA